MLRTAYYPNTLPQHSATTNVVVVAYGNVFVNKINRYNSLEPYFTFIGSVYARHCPNLLEVRSSIFDDGDQRVRNKALTTGIPTETILSVDGTAEGLIRPLTDLGDQVSAHV